MSDTSTTENGNQVASQMISDAIRDVRQDAPTTPQETPGDAETADVVVTPEQWYGGLDDGTRAMVDAHTAGLRTALKTERDNARSLAKQIKELSSKSSDGEAWKVKLEGISAQLTEANLKAAFYEDAANQPALPTRRYAAAYKIAKLDGLIDEDGTVDWKALQEQNDYLFTTPAPEPAQRKGHAGSGLNGGPQPKRNINDVLRSGRG